MQTSGHLEAPTSRVPIPTHDLIGIARCQRPRPTEPPAPRRASLNEFSQGCTMAPLRATARRVIPLFRQRRVEDEECRTQLPRMMRDRDNVTGIPLYTMQRHAQFLRLFPGVHLRCPLAR